MGFWNDNVSDSEDRHSNNDDNNGDINDTYDSNYDNKLIIITMTIVMLMTIAMNDHYYSPLTLHTWAFEMIM